MIKSLHVRDYLLIPELNIELSNGLTVFTGETGAGKSLIVDSLALALGSRAESGVVRKGCEKAEIFITFEVSTSRVKTWLHHNDYENGDECIVRRNLYSQRPSKAFINGRPVTVQTLRELGELLVDIHGQHEHQLLLRKQEQRRILDGYAGHLDNIAKLEEISTSIRKKQNLREEMLKMRQELESRSELLAHQIETLEQLEPTAEEFSRLNSELEKLSNAEELSASLENIAQRLLYGDDGTASNILSDCIRQLDELVQYDETLEECRTMMDEASVRVNDAAREMRSVSDRIESDPARITELESRMAALQHQARIHSTTADTLDAKLMELVSESAEVGDKLQAILNIDTSIHELEQQYNEIADMVSASRKKAAESFTEEVTGLLGYLGMETGVFEVRMEQLPDSSFSRYGNENIEFFVATNNAQEVGLLSKVASGGELSRISLAIQIVASDVTEVSSVVFDEVDVGIGGRVAESVGKLLRKLGNTAQVLCITHLPQVASMGNNQMKVVKHSGNNATIDVEHLNNEDRILEIARMLGGAKITERTTAHAKEMLLQEPQ